MGQGRSYVDTLSALLRVLIGSGSTEAQIKSVAGPILEARDSGDTAYIIVRGLDPVGDDDLVNKRFGDANYGGGMTGAMRVILFPIALITVDSTTSLPAGAIVFDTTVDITTPYSGGTSIEVGDTGGTADLYMGSTENNAQVANLYSKTQETTGVATTIRATISGGPAAGAGFVAVFYSVPDA